MAVSHRTGLIHETLGTLNAALRDEILVTIIVIVIMVMHLRSSILISGLLPVATLMCFIGMKVMHVDANIVALSGIAIAIGTMVDMGIVICENILKHLEEADPDENRLEVVYRAASEVGGAVLTAVSTTIVGFLPVFTMQAAEGKLFGPLAWTKTMALFSSVIVALTLIPPFAHILFTGKINAKLLRRAVYAGVVVLGAIVGVVLAWWLGALIAALGVFHLAKEWLPKNVAKWFYRGANVAAAIVVAAILATHWLPLGPEKGFVRNFIFVGVVIGGLLGAYELFRRAYGVLLGWCLRHKLLFLCVPAFIFIVGVMVWQGFDRFFGWVPNRVRTFAPAGFVAEKIAPLRVLPKSMREFAPVSFVAHKFPGLGKEFMPPLDEGSFLFMPTTMPHASIGEATDMLQKQDMAIRQIPEVETVVGKAGRAESPLDPAPYAMFETVINYKPQYFADNFGKHLTYRFDPEKHDYFRDADGKPVPAPDGEPYIMIHPINLSVAIWVGFLALFGIATDDGVVVA
ncbi:MAG TPA: efflux RND transporter permease subunit, partial [Phycisphaerae bacterium]|nr:efflux RND transporter permease subunit [Phycisphaerae bacterium]